MAKLYIIQGFLGAGKSTFSKKLASQTNSLILNPDEWTAKLFNKSEYEANWNLCFSQTVQKLWKCAKKHLKNGQNIIFDMGFWDRNSRDEAKKFALENGAEFIHYYIYAPDKILKARISQRKGAIAENNLKNFDKIKKNFTEPEQDENAIKIDNY